ncbi:MAG: efflux transporter periplasmic adaptor subunit, partial [Polaromonas sp.]|nr:efflux transporter periplasmic adaptor subunit [Polaromonas sp.]
AASAPQGGAPGTPAAAAPASVSPPVPVAAPAGGPAATAPASAAAGAPTADQLKRFLDQVKDDPEALARRQSLVDKIKQGDAAALERWQKIRERRRDNNQAPAQ